MQVTAPLPGQLEDISTPVVVNSYVVESLASILLVVKYILILKNLTETIHLTDLFAVYKTDFELIQWTDVDRCSDFWKDRLVFLGGNHSLSLSARDFPKLNIDKGSVYYTDDFRDIIYINNSSFVGHDLGVFGVPELGSFGNNIKSDFFALFSYNHTVRKLIKWRIYQIPKPRFNHLLFRSFLNPGKKQCLRDLNISIWPNFFLFSFVINHSHLYIMISILHSYNSYVFVVHPIWIPIYQSISEC